LRRIAKLGVFKFLGSYSYVWAARGTFQAMVAWPTKRYASGVRTSRVFTLSGSAFHFSWASFAVA
jgi:hypothetical protein